MKNVGGDIVKDEYGNPMQQLPGFHSGSIMGNMNSFDSASSFDSMSARILSPVSSIDHRNLIHKSQAQSKKQSHARPTTPKPILSKLMRV